MSEENRLKMLIRKHQDLEIRIKESMKKNVCDFSEIQTLKKEKLQIKDEIEKLRNSPDIIA